jgi:hypothetical protein
MALQRLLAADAPEGRFSDGVLLVRLICAG